jgi:hypothetical protein
MSIFFTELKLRLLFDLLMYVFAPVKYSDTLLNAGYSSKGLTDENSASNLMYSPLTILWYIFMGVVSLHEN